ERVGTQALGEGRDDGDRAPLANEDRLLAEALLDGPFGRGDIGTFQRHQNSWRAVIADDLQRHTQRAERPQEFLERRRYLLRLLFGDQPKADLGEARGGDDAL